MKPHVLLALGFVGFTVLTQIWLLLLWLEQRRDVKRKRKAV